MVAKNRNKIVLYFSLIFLASIFVFSLNFTKINSYEVDASVNQDLAIPSNWSNCSEVPGNVNNDLTATESGVIPPFWNQLLGMTINQEKDFIVPNSQHNYGDNLEGKDLYYLVRINSISNGVAVNSASSVPLQYSLYIDCVVSSVGTTETTSSSASPTSSSSSPDNIIPLLAGLGVVAIGLGTAGYFTIIKPRAELPQDTKIIEEKQAKKQMNQTKELLDLIQDKKEGTKTKTPKESPSKQKSSKRPRRR